MNGRGFTALDVLHLATIGDRVQKAISSATQTLLTDWWGKAPGKSDDDILRDKLVECGWKYSRKDGTWYHPKMRELGQSYPAPRDLRSLAEIAAKAVLSNIQNEQGS